MKRSILVVSTILVFLSVAGAGQSQEPFRINKEFPVNFLFKTDIPDLGALNRDELGKIKNVFLGYKDKVESKEQALLIQLGLSRIEFLQGNYREAVDILKNRFTGSSPWEDYRTYFSLLGMERLADQLLESGDSGSALKNYQNAIELAHVLMENYPESQQYDHLPETVAHLEKGLGQVYLNSGDIDKALFNFRKSLLREFPDNEEHRLDLYRRMIQAYEREKDYELAIDLLNHLLNREPAGQNLDEARKFLERNASDFNERSDAVTNFRSRVEILLKEETSSSEPPSSPGKKEEPIYRQAEVQAFYSALESKDWEKAFSSGLRIMNEFPGVRDARKVRGLLSKTLVDYLKNHSWTDNLDPLLQVFPLKDLNNLGLAFWNKGMPDNAARAYESLLRRFPNEVSFCHKALFFLGRIKEDQQKFDEAESYYRSLVRNYDYGTYYFPARFKIGWMHYLKQEWVEAQNEFKIFLDSFEGFSSGHFLSGDPKEFISSTLYWLAQVEGRLEHEDRKKAFLQQLIEEYPFAFYSMLARFELEHHPLSFIDGEQTTTSVARSEGLGDIGRYRIFRAEGLISVGLMREARNELSFLMADRNDAAFWMYLSGLKKKALDYQKSIKMGWVLSKKVGLGVLPRKLVGLLFPEAFIRQAEKESLHYQLDPYLVLALMRQESAFNARVISRARAIGLMQMIPPTAQKVAEANGIQSLDLEDLKKPEVNIHLGVYYLNQLLEQFEDNPVYALASYNAGPHRIQNWIRHRPNLSWIEFLESIPYTETRNYVKKVLRNFVIYKSFYSSTPIRSLKQMFLVRVAP